ncbi:hypothetical protein AAC387_Pa03g3524 [Persea americana]
MAALSTSFLQIYRSKDFQVIDTNCFYIGLSLASSSCNSTVHLEMEVLKVVQVLILDQFACLVRWDELLFGN